MSASAIYPLVIERLPFEKYRELPGLNASALLRALDSPLDYLHYTKNERADSDTYRIGRAAHTATGEALRFLHEYAMYDGRRAGKAWDEFQEANKGKTILKPDQYDLACAMSEAVRNDDVSGPIYAERGRSELTLMWRHSSGALLKARLDWLCSVLADLKTTSAPTDTAFDKQAYDLRYHVRMAFYLDGVRACGLGDPPVKLIAVRNKAPHAVWVRPYDLAQLDSGRAQYEKAIAIIGECSKTGKWPGPANGQEVPMRFPAWASENRFNEDEVIDFGAEAIA